MAITSSKILNSGKTNVTKLLTGLDSPYSYNGMGVGNNTEAASESDTGLKGDEVSFKNGNASYFTNANGSFIAQWNSSWVYNDLPSNELSEGVVSQNASNGSSYCLLRAVFDKQILGENDALKITAQVAVTQG